MKTLGARAADKYIGASARPRAKDDADDDLQHDRRDADRLRSAGPLRSYAARLALGDRGPFSLDASKISERTSVAHVFLFTLDASKMNKPMSHCFPALLYALALLRPGVPQRCTRGGAQ